MKCRWKGCQKNEAKQSGAKHKSEGTTSKSQSVEKNGKHRQEKNEQNGQLEKSHSRKKVPSRKRIIEKKETNGIEFKRLNLNLQETTGLTKNN